MKRDIRRKTERAIIRYFEKELLPAATAIKEQGRVFFPEKPDPEAVTYYTRCRKRTVSAGDFILEGCASFEKLQEALAGLWREQGYPELARTAPTAAALARKLYTVESESDEVSPFIYVMF